jgi:glycogen synthase
MRNGMSKDFSWNVEAREYVKVYERARQLRTAPSPPAAVPVAP